MELEIMRIKKKENIMTIVLVFLLILFCFVVLFVISNKGSSVVIEKPITDLDASNYVKIEEIDTSAYSSVYKNVDLKKVKFSNITEVLLSDFYTNQDNIITTLESNIHVNKQFIENYNKENNITNYSANSKIETILLYEINDNVLSVIYLVEDIVDYKEVSNNINNIFIDLKNNSVLDNETLLDKYNLTNIDVLKVGHHGSKTSSSIEFINKINPKYSIISVGKNNRYGHPNKEV